MGTLELLVDFVSICRMIIVAAFVLNIAHPGPVFAGQGKGATGFADPEVEAAHSEAK